MCNICSTTLLVKVANSLLSMNSLTSVSFNLNMCDSCKEERFKIEEKIRESKGQILQSQISTEQENLHGTVLPPNAVLKKYIIDSRLSCKKLKMQVLKERE